MKLLYVFGEDYAATAFENLRDAGTVDPKALWAEALEAADTLVFDNGDEYFEYVAYEFDAVDPKFVEFVKTNLIDYDDGKTANVYVIDA